VSFVFCANGCYRSSWCVHLVSAFEVVRDRQGLILRVG